MLLNVHHWAESIALAVISLTKNYVTPILFIVARDALLACAFSLLWKDIRKLTKVTFFFVLKMVTCPYDYYHYYYAHNVVQGKCRNW